MFTATATFHVHLDGVLLVLVPCNSATVGLYDPATSTVRAGPSVGAGNFPKYNGGVLLPDGRVVLVPFHSLTIWAVRSRAVRRPISIAASLHALAASVVLMAS